ncbi:hypothetical protein [Vibrio sp. SCSIO 43137]|uniref:hypothetical protein n=1 Tax=Vibrio sp. SCSIO 43137 TaxID=3021011 RepID=UPI00230728A2|nr:hypothetical protein [Vibrio sp. SCSIO 43137]WCE29962.1 hypothetical protein PK654_01220 [Vibrio sp. SCSIO 43137]
MQQFNIDELKHDLAAMDAGDELTNSVLSQIESLKGMDKGKLMQKAMGAAMSGNLSLEAFGLPTNLFEQLETLTKINNVARSKYRATVNARIHELESIEEAEVVENV